MDGLNNEISDVNLSYLLLAQRMLKNDRVAAMYRMGISKELADLLAKLTLSQIVKLSSSSSLLCRFRFDDHTILAALTHTNKEHHLQQAHVSILLADQQVERGV